MVQQTICDGCSSVCMQMEWLAAITGFCFFYYGLTCLFSSKMEKEFRRFGLTHQQRMLTGILQILGAIGLGIGIYLPFIGMAAALGLTVQMLLGFGVRMKIKDSIMQSYPSFFFMLVNGYLFYFFYAQVSA